MPNAPIDTQIVHATALGGPEVLMLVRGETPPPGPGEVRVVQEACGLNFADIYQRRGEPGPHEATVFPYVPGAQGAGTVESVGEGVTDLQPGDRVAYILPGSYRSARLVPAARCVKLPDDVSTTVAGATLLRGLTAEYLLNRLFPVTPGRRVLIHAAAGGMGSILVPWAKALGGEVFATAGGAEKCAMVRAAGADHVIDYQSGDWVPAVLDLTGGEGVHCVYDSVGRDTFMGALEVLAPMGMAINYGTASGPVPAFPLQMLHAKSLIVTRPTLRTWIASRADLDAAAERLFREWRRGALPLEVGRTWPLSAVRDAHAALEARETTGSLALIPDA
jgi:NADPH2:quinone reductase